MTHLCGAPIVVNLAIQAMERAAPGRRIRMMTAGAAPAAATLRRAAAAGLDVTHVYGMTETFGPAAVCEARSSWPAAEVPIEEQNGAPGRSRTPRAEDWTSSSLKRARRCRATEGPWARSCLGATS